MQVGCALPVPAEKGERPEAGAHRGLPTTQSVRLADVTGLERRRLGLLHPARLLQHLAQALEHQHERAEVAEAAEGVDGGHRFAFGGVLVVAQYGRT